MQTIGHMQPPVAGAPGVPNGGEEQMQAQAPEGAPAVMHVPLRFACGFVRIDTRDIARARRRPRAATVRPGASAGRGGGLQGQRSYFGGR